MASLDVVMVGSDVVMVVGFKSMSSHPSCHSHPEEGRMGKWDMEREVGREGAVPRPG